MIRFFGSRGASAVVGLVMLVLGSNPALAQVAPSSFDLKSTIASTAVGSSAALAIAPTAPATTVSAAPTLPATTAPATVTAPRTVTIGNGIIIAVQPASAVTLPIGPAINREAAWLFKNGWPLYALVDRYSTGAALDAEAICLATAVYFEARGESLEGQLAVARVVMNRAASGKYPPSWCATVKQHAQFSFVRNGQFPAISTGSDAWRKAQAITRLAMSNVIPSLSTDVLWYHANYVAPTWRRNLVEAQKIGVHIFYRS